MHLIKPSECLIHKLKEDLLNCWGKNLSHVTIVLPTQRLGTYLIAWLTNCMEAIYPPQIMTLEKFIRSQSENGSLSVAPDATIDLWLQRHLLEQSYPLVQCHHYKELRVLENELAENNVPLKKILWLIEELKNDSYKSEEHLEVLAKKLNSIHNALVALRHFLASHNLETAAHQLATKATNLMQSWHSKKNCPAAEELIFAGFTSLAQSWQPLMRSLYQMNNVKFYFVEPPALYNEHHPLQNLITAVTGEKLPWTPPLWSEKTKLQPQVMEYHSIMDECLGAFSTAQKYVEIGIPPSQIAILATNEAQYAPFLHGLKSAFPIATNAPISLPFSACTAGAWLQLWWQTLENPANSASFYNWISHPASLRFLNKALGKWQCTETFLRSWSASLIQHKEFLGWSQKLPQSSKNLEITRGLQKIITHALEPFHLSRDAPNMLDLVMSIIELSNSFEIFADEPEKNGLGPAALECMAQFLRMFQVGEPLVRGTFLDQRASLRWLLEKLWQMPIRPTGEPLAGVQVLSLAESRLVPFSVVIILGCNEGSFPKAIPPDELIDDHLKRQLGLLGWRNLEAMEDLTFSSLLERVPQLILSRYCWHDKEATVRSRFADHVLHRLNTSATQILGLSLRKYLPELKTKRNPAWLSPDGETKFPELLKTTSVTALEKFLRCPYSFLLDRLRCEGQTWESLFKDHSTSQGQWMHQILEIFFTSHKNGKRIIEDWPEEITKENFQKIGYQRLVFLTEFLGPRNIKGKPVFYQLLHWAWPAFLDHLESIYGPDSFAQIKKGTREWVFQCEPSDANTFPQKIQGVVDSIDRVDTYQIITDYKRSTAPDSRDIRLGISPQLSLYSMATTSHNSEEQADALVTGYWKILPGKWISHGTGELSKDWAKQRQLATSRTPTTFERIAAFDRIWKFRQGQQIEKQLFCIDTSECGYCRYAPICRKNDPQRKKNWGDCTSLNRLLGEKNHDISS